MLTTKVCCNKSGAEISRQLDLVKHYLLAKISLRKQFK
jgi:hypothetical protein